MKITQKFLLFGLVPALAQAGISFQLFSLLASVEYYASKEVQQSLISRTLVAGVAQSMEVALAAGAYTVSPTIEIAKRVALASKQADKTFADLRAMTTDDPPVHAEIEELVSLGTDSKRDYLSMQRISSTIPVDSPLQHLPMEDIRNSQTLIKRIRKLSQILERENARLEDVRLKQTQNRKAVKDLVLIELCISVGIIAACYILFRYDFGRRFNNLLQIARELALDEPTTKTISGSDELSDLSKALTTAAEARREAVAQKQILFQMVTHDLRSPLMAAALVVDALSQDTKATVEKTQNRLQSVARSIQRVIGLANDLLTIERLSSGGLEISKSEVDFQKTMAQAIESVQPLAEQKQCRLENHSPNLLVAIDEDRILQITVNLLANAIKFSPPGAAVEIVAEKEGNRLRVQVLDRGPGISDKDIKRLFNPFQQGSDGDKAAGFGLGLAIAKMLVELLDGKIGARPREDGGTIFWFTIGL